MALFDKILSFFRKADNTAQPHPTCEEHRAVLAFEKDLDFFMHEDDFKSRKEYQYLCDNDLSSIKTEGFRYEVINNYLKSSILQYPELVDKLILFFGSYFDAPYEGDDLNAFFNYLKKFRILTFLALPANKHICIFFRTFPTKTRQVHPNPTTPIPNIVPLHSL